jgi:hypothetical protein
VYEILEPIVPIVPDIEKPSSKKIILNVLQTLPRKSEIDWFCFAFN